MRLEGLVSLAGFAIQIARYAHEGTEPYFCDVILVHGGNKAHDTEPLQGLLQWTTCRSHGTAVYGGPFVV